MEEENMGDQSCCNIRKFSTMNCKACHSNQRNPSGCRKVRKSWSNYFRIKRITEVPVWSMIVFVWMAIFVGFTQGLQCYECLSLYCDSGAVCDAIKNTMVKVFVPKRHFIHFDPSDICPENELPFNSTRWANLSRPCERSDSLCLVSPIEVHTVVDGKKHGKKLENEYTLTTYGYLRGCASRRKLLEFPDTINVRFEFAGRNRSESNNKVVNNPRGDRPVTPSPGNGIDNGGGTAGSGNGNGKSGEIFYNMTNVGSAADFDPTNKVYTDGYTITKIYSHIFYIDQGTQNATKCYEDNCNDKVKFRRSGSSGMIMLTTNGKYSLYYVLVVTTFVILGYERSMYF